MGRVPGSPVTQLAQGARQIGLELSQASCERLLDYATLLRRWNQVHNLTTIDDTSKMLTHHLLDSLSIAPFVSGDRCLDIGSGAGLPGMVMALAQPQQQWTLVESRAKKASFLREAKARALLLSLSTTTFKSSMRSRRNAWNPNPWQPPWTRA